MISAVNNSPNFTGIVPLRVFVDGQQTKDPKLVKSAVRKLTSVLIKPKENSNIAELFSKFDPIYSKVGYSEKTKPSDFFKLIIDNYRGIFLATGKQTETINKYGKLIGKQKGYCKDRRVNESLDLLVAKRNYADIINAILSSAKLRFYEITDKWCPVTLNINIKNNKLENILFTT